MYICMHAIGMSRHKQNTLPNIMKMSNSSAAKYVNSWVGFTWMLPLIVATLADSYWDRYSTILASSVLYSAGLFALTSMAVPWPWIPTNKVRSISSVSWSLYMISLGQAGYNPSLQAFGADQLENEDDLPCTNSDDQSSAKKSLFFQWSYFGVCCGSLQFVMYKGVVVISYTIKVFLSLYMERFAFEGVASNLVSYLANVSWVGFTWMLPLIVATLAESYRDRHSTILASSLLYSGGLFTLTSMAMPSPWIPTNKVHSISSVSWSLYMLSLGQAGYNPSLQTFGANQLENEDELPCTISDDQNSDKKSLFFQWWWFYMHKQGEKSLKEIIQTIKMRMCKIINRRNGQWSNDYTLFELEREEKSLCEQEQEMDHDNPIFEQNPEEHVHPLEAAKIVLRLLPVWMMLLIFAVIFQQPATFFTKQGMTMKRNIGSKIKIPLAALQSAITISINHSHALVPHIFHTPRSCFYTNRKGHFLMPRMGLGCVFRS
ncbi:H+/oligopeptide symporter [Handroanthus impetiginosus]|uniref:H+/oligopeptide symporter n=1 Tax=Handroanthus impetiginosus TaxID=429701 RepID=A0A2G9I1U1_9LAMI|nr:H+/oligopeptide symporter [Handroanthus impetiginosus]